MRTFPYKKWNPFVQLDWHDGIFMTGPIPVTGSAAHIAGGVLSMPWIGLGTRKSNGDSILADGQAIVSEGHAPGHLLIPHINLFPFPPPQWNLLFPFLIAMSSNDCAMSVGSVVGPDGPVSVSIFRCVGLNQGCTDIAAQTKLPVKGMKDVPKAVPIAFALIPNSVVYNWGTVNLGFTLGDLLRFAAKTLLQAAVDKIFDKLFKKLQDALTIRLRPDLEDYLPKSSMKNMWLNVLRRTDLPKVGRAGDGQFMSIAEALGDNTYEVGDMLLGKLFDAAGHPDDVALLDIKGQMTSTASDAATKLGELVDGKAELIP
ncbi:MAG: hypothetical protein R3A79_03345 [Nannocystaceae bacterium]